MPALCTLPSHRAQNALDLEQTTHEAMDCCQESQRAARAAILRLHNAGELDPSAADIARLEPEALSCQSASAKVTGEPAGSPCIRPALMPARPKAAFVPEQPRNRKERGGPVVIQQAGNDDGLQIRA